MRARSASRFFVGVLLLLLVSAALTPMLSVRTSAVAVTDAHRQRVAPTLPMLFEPNRGQSPKGTAFVARGEGYSMSVGARGASLALRGEPGTSPRVLQMELAGAARTTRLVAEDRRPGLSHYLIGHDPDRHLRDIPQFGKVVSRHVYPGVDLIYYGNQRRLEYDFVVAPGADPARIRLHFSGHDAIEIATNGDLVFRLGDRELRQTKPVLYQLPDREPVDGRFELAEDGTVSFQIDRWDRSRPLVIDPTLVFGTYLGGSLSDTATSVAVDPSGNIYVCGTTTSTNFPSVGAYQGSNGGGASDAFVTKLNPTGTAVLYSTYLGGGAADDGRGIAVDATGSAYLGGSTFSSNFPKNSALSSACGNGTSSEAFIVKLAPAGNALTYGVCFGIALSNDATNGVALDATANAYVTGSSGGANAFVGRLNAAGNGWTYFNTVGGSSTDEGFGIGADAAGNACVTGRTQSSNFPTVNALQPTFLSFLYTAFVAKYDSSGNPVYATYLGGTGLDSGFGAAIDASGRCFVVGVANSTNFPVQNAAQPTASGFGDAFVTAYTANGSAYLYSTYLGGTVRDSGFGIAVSPAGVAHVVGQSDSFNFPAVNPVQLELKDFGSVHTSTDAAATFTRSALAGVTVQALAVDPTNDQVIYAGTSTGIYKTVNGGSSWVRVDSGLTYTNVVAMAIDPNAPCTVYAGIETSLVFSTTNTTAMLAISTNCGASWGFGFISGQSTRSLSFSNSNPAYLYSGIVVNTATPGLTMHRVTRTLGGTTDFSLSFEDGSYVVAADPANPCTVYAGGILGTVRKNSSCGAISWSLVGATLPAAVRALAVHPTNQATVLAGTSAGIIYRKLDAASPWTQVGTMTGAVNSVVYHPTDGQIAYAAGSGGVVYKTVDGGASWSPASTIGPGVSSLRVSSTAPAVVRAGTVGNYDGFYTQLSAAGVILGSTWVGGHGADVALGVALNGNDAVVAGTTSAVNFPVTGGVAYTTSSGGGDSFVVSISPAAAAPGAFAKTAPANGATGLPTNPSLTWTASSGATGYEYCFDTTNDNACGAWSPAGNVLGAGVTGLSPATPYYWQVRATNAGGNTAADGGTFWSFTTAPLSGSLVATPSSLRFGATKLGAGGAVTSVTPAQLVTVTFMGAPTSWTATSNQPWLQVSSGQQNGAGQFSATVVNPGNVIGGSTLLTATLTITAPTSPNSPLQIPVTLAVDQTNQATVAPFGQIDTPAQNVTGLQGAIGVTGWVLDDVGVQNVRVYRTCVASDPVAACQVLLGHNVVYIGDGVFLAGARPDVAASFPSLPQNHRAGWGMQILSNMLPHMPTGQAFGGQGTLSLFVYATDIEGHVTLLGRSQTDHTPTTVTLDNDHIAKPFGTVDTPGSGATISGVVANFGWAITPDTDTIAGNGDVLISPTSPQMFVFIDGQAVAVVAYNQCRGTVGNPPPAGVFCNDDVSNIFGNLTPQAPLVQRLSNPTRFRNLDAARGAIGAYVMDTTALANGMHSLAWSVTDSLGRTEGIGSRLFEVLNSGPGAQRPAAEASLVRSARTSADRRERMTFRTGFDFTAPFAPLASRAGAVPTVQSPELGRIEIDLAGPIDHAYLHTGNGPEPLPAGSSIDPARGRFTWAPVAGYLGTYRLVFVRGADRISVDVSVGR